MCKYRTYQNERTEFTEHKISPDILYHVAAIFTRLMLYDYDMPRSIWWWFYMRIHRTYLQDSNHCLKIATATAHCIRIIITMAKTPITASKPLHKCSSFFLCCCWCWCWSWCRCCRCCCYCSFLPVQTWFNRIHDTSIYLSIISYICCILLLALSDGDCVSVLYWTIRNSIKCICSRSASFSVSLPLALNRSSVLSVSGSLLSSQCVCARCSLSRVFASFAGIVSEFACIEYVYMNCVSDAKACIVSHRWCAHKMMGKPECWEKHSSKSDFMCYVYYWTWQVVS